MVGFSRMKNCWPDPFAEVNVLMSHRNLPPKCICNECTDYDAVFMKANVLEMDRSYKLQFMKRVFNFACYLEKWKTALSLILVALASY